MATKCKALDKITTQILDNLKDGIVPWKPGHFAKSGLPRNFKSGKVYQGINFFSLGMQRYESPWFLTYLQAKELGGHVRKGEKGHSVIKVGSYSVKDKSALDKEVTRKFIKGYSVFNAYQIEGIDFPPTHPVVPDSRHGSFEHIEKLIADMPNPPAICEGRRARACYCPGSDEVDMPSRSFYTQAEGFYHDLFHELVHSTGHKDRLNRDSLYQLPQSDLGITTAKQSYGLEELVAEMGSCILSVETGIYQNLDPNLENASAYINSWMNALSDKGAEHWISQAASYSQKAVDYISNKAAQNSGELSLNPPC